MRFVSASLRCAVRASTSAREALDRGHDRALLRVVGGVDEAVVVAVRITSFSTRASASEAAQRGVERGELLRREVRRAHQVLQRSAAARGSTPASPSASTRSQNEES